MSGTGRELRLLDPAIIAGIGSMELRARTIVEGFLAGLHRSPMKGFSVEFAELLAAKDEQVAAPIY